MPEYVDWVPFLNVYETPRDVSPVVRTDGSNQTRLSRPSVVSPFLAEPFEIFMATAVTSSLCCASLLPLCSCRSRDQFAVVAACCFSVQFFAFFLPLHRAYRSFKLFMPPFDLILYRQRSSRPCVVVTPSAFLHFFLSRVVRAVVLLVIDAYVHTLYTLLDPFPFCTHSLSHLIPHSICSARFYFLFRVTCGSRFACPILMRGGSYGLA